MHVLYNTAAVDLLSVLQVLNAKEEATMGFNTRAEEEAVTVQQMAGRTAVSICFWVRV